MENLNHFAALFCIIVVAATLWGLVAMHRTEHDLRAMVDECFRIHLLVPRHEAKQILEELENVPIRAHIWRRFTCRSPVPIYPLALQPLTQEALAR